MNIEQLKIEAIRQAITAYCANNTIDIMKLAKDIYAFLTS